MMLYRQTSAPIQPRFRRQPGRNQELNTRLQTKADELERLFAEHKRRAHGSGGDHHRRDEAESSTTIARGELYERYAQRRESKMRRESGAKREERAAAMEALRESLERSSAELKLQQRSTTIRRDRDQLVKNSLSEEEEDDDKQSDTSYKSVNSKLLPPTRRTMSSSLGRSSNSSLNRPIAIPRPPAMATAGSARGSDVRKENAKPSSMTVATNFPRSKSTSTAGSSSCKQGKPTMTSSSSTSSRPLKPLQTVLKPSAVASDISEAAVRDGVASPTASAASSGLTRKKWGGNARAISVAAGPDASCQPRKDTAGKGIKRFLQFGRRKKGAESADAQCSPGSGTASEVTNKSGSEYHAPRRHGFGDDGQVQTRGSSMAAASPASCKLKEDQSPRGAPRSFFSLPSFRNREGDSKLGR
ncbi:uncharacterized protein M6B38_154765 [Iris pallida]|uniref:Uncharacterized protein n=2 Tax=Iris pallida TaxID=29817 RepID=A0AAX6F555_IRIPA|nr:uncharacterized protein M6B38_154765 [Iris pallida]